MKALIAGGMFAIGSLVSPPVSAEEPVKIGFLGDMSGPVAALDSIYTVEAIKMAIEAHGGKALGKPVEFVIGDMQFKLDLAISIAQRWYEEEGVDAIVGVPMSPAAIQIGHLAERFDRIMLTGTSGTRALTTTDCTANTVHYGWNTETMANIVPKALVEQGKKKWFFLTMDYAYGVDQTNQAIKTLDEVGGVVVGQVKYPLNQTDFSGYLLEAQSTGADVIAVASSGADTQAIIKQANEFGIKAAGATLVVFAMTVVDVKSLGLEAFSDVHFATPFYWNGSPAKREFGLEFIRRTKQAPNWFQGNNYSATLTYLRAVDAAGTKKASEVMKAIKSMVIRDLYADGGRVRADGQMVHDMYLARVKRPGDPMLNEWDLFDIVATLPEERVFPPMENCKLLK